MAGIAAILRQLRSFMATRRADGHTDARLLEQFVSQRDELAFAALLERHGPMVLGVCRRILHDEHRAEDAFQATFLVLCRKANAIRKRTSIASWLHGVAVRLASKAKADAIRATRPDVRNPSEKTGDVQAEASWHEAQRVLDDELQRLPENYRLPLVLCYLEGLTRDEAATRLDLTANQLRGRLERGRERLRARLIRRGVTLAAAGSATLLADTILAATVPPLLAVATVRAAVQLATGFTLATCGVSVSVVSLTEGGLKMLAAKKMAMVVALVLMVGFLGVGVGLVAQRDEPVQTKPVDDPPAPVAAQEPAKVNEPKKAGVDRFGDALPEHAVARLGTVRFRHDGAITFAAFLPDGKTVLSAGEDGTIRIWEYPSGRELRRIVEPPAQTDSKVGLFRQRAAIPSLSKDGKTLATSFDRSEILLFDVATGKKIQALHPRADQKGLSARQDSLTAFSPDGLRLAILSADGSAHVWDWAKAKPLCTLAGPNGIPNALLRGNIVWSPDGKVLATLITGVNAKALEIWDPVTGDKLHTIAPNNEQGVKGTQRVLGFAFSPDSKTLAYATFDRITLADVATGKKIRSWANDPSTAMVSFSPDGAKLYGRWDWQKILVEWNVSDGKVLRKIAVDTSKASTERTVASASAAWSPDGRSVVLTGGGCALQFVDIVAGNEIAFGANPAAALAGVHFTPDGKDLWARSSIGRAFKWDALTGKPLSLPALPNPLLQGPSSPDGKLLVSSSSAEPERGVFVDADTGKELGLLPRLYPEDYRAMVFSLDSKMLAVRQRQITLYEAPTGKLLHVIPINKPVQKKGAKTLLNGFPAVMFFSPDGKILAAFADDNMLALWNTASGQHVGKLSPANAITAKGRLSRIKSGAFSPDGRCLALDFPDGTAILYELASAKIRRRFGIPTEPPPPKKAPVGIYPQRVPERSIAFGHGGYTLIHAGMGDAIHVWDVDNGNELATLKGHTDSVEGIAVSADGKTLASASADTTVLLWDLTRVKRPVPAVKALAPSELDARWQTLLDVDAAQAFAAICDLSASPKETLALLTERLKPALPLEMKRIDALLAALESDQFNTRQEADAELKKMDGRVVPAIDRFLAKSPSLEFKRRLDELRQYLGGSGVLHGEPLRMYRAVEIIERIGTAEARQLLRTLANGAPGASLTIAAQTSLQRFK
jgi:RNA polymerase sigma factor (sigma-70 family)